jgi:hypothetical protein
MNRLIGRDLGEEKLSSAPIATSLGGERSELIAELLSSEPRGVELGSEMNTTLLSR